MYKHFYNRALAKGEEVCAKGLVLITNGKAIHYYGIVQVKQNKKKQYTDKYRLEANSRPHVTFYCSYAMCLWYTECKTRMMSNFSVSCSLSMFPLCITFFFFKDISI